MNNMVYMGVGAEGYFVDPTAGMQAVTWDPQSFTHPAMGADPPAVLNDADIVNLNVDVSVSGATVTTGYGGGEALKGWAIAVLSGDDPTALTPVEGAPAMLDTAGMASFKTTLMPDDLPTAYHFGVAPDQADAMDGGENYEGTTASYVHTGLSLAGTKDAGMIEVAFTTQTLKVYAHHERDQVMGYTGNVLDGDMRDDGKVSVSLRYIDDSGRSRSFAPADSVGSSSKDGVTTFTNVPADRNVIVQASVSETLDIMLLGPDELAAYTGTEANGITGGHFGAHGGYSHSVSLCPLQDTNPQDHGECSSFAYVSTYNVSGLVWKRGVSKDGDDFEEKAVVRVPGQTVSLSPVEGKNLAGEDQSYTTAEDDNTRTDIDERVAFNFDDVASGAYTLSVPDGWRARMGDMGSETMLGDALSPLGANLSIDVTPATATVFGRVDGSDGFAVDSVTVSVGGQSAMTDSHGRYIVDGIAAGKKFVISASKNGSSSKTDSLTFAANTVTEHNIDLMAAAQTASISGTVRASGTNAPVAGAEITVMGSKVTNLNSDKKLLTGADGTYTAIVEAVDLGGTVTLSASKAGMTFVPASLSAPAHAGAAISGIDFTGFVNATISGRVVAPGGGPQMGAVVSATSTADSTSMVVDTTGVTGTFSLNVPFGSYTIAASLDQHTFDYPTTGQVVSVAPGQQVSFGSIQAKTAGALNVRASRMRVLDDANTDADESVPTRWATTISVMYDSDAENIPEGYNAPTYTIQTNTGTDGAWTAATATEVVDGDNVAIPGSWTITTPTANDGGDGEFMVRVVTAADRDHAFGPACPVQPHLGYGYGCRGRSVGHRRDGEASGRGGLNRGS